MTWLLSHPHSPEGLGVLSGAVYLITLFLFIPVPFLHTFLINSQYSFEVHEVGMTTMPFLELSYNYSRNAKGIPVPSLLLHK